MYRTLSGQLTPNTSTSLSSFGPCAPISYTPPPCDHTCASFSSPCAPCVPAAQPPAASNGKTQQHVAPSSAVTRKSDTRSSYPPADFVLRYAATKPVIILLMLLTVPRAGLRVAARDNTRVARRGRQRQRRVTNAVVHSHSVRPAVGVGVGGTHVSVI